MLHPLEPYGASAAVVKRLVAHASVRTIRLGSMDSPQRATSPLLGQALPVELMNTIWGDRHGIHDSLASVEDARSWISAVNPRLEPPARERAGKLTDDELAPLRDLRDALRRIAAERTGDPRERAASAMADLGTAIDTVNEHARRAQIRPILELAKGGAIVERSKTAAAPHELLVGTLATAAIGLFGHPNDVDLRACLAPGCVLYFIKDHPRREWCSTACGNRARAARHYARHGRAHGAE